jgi:hypothetical protein
VTDNFEILTMIAEIVNQNNLCYKMLWTSVEYTVKIEENGLNHLEDLFNDVRCQYFGSTMFYLLDKIS